MKSKTNEILEEEHKNILKLIEILERKITDISNEKKINKEFLEKSIYFIRNYADKIHHAKEEDILFVEFEKNLANAHCNPVQQMLVEHNIGRDAIKKAEEGIKEKNNKKVIAGFEEYINLLKEHIFKEDNILYPMCDEVIDDKTKKKMLEDFKKADKRSEKEREKCLEFLRQNENKKYK